MECIANTQIIHMEETGITKRTIGLQTHVSSSCILTQRFAENFLLLVAQAYALYVTYSNQSPSKSAKIVEQPNCSNQVSEADKIGCLIWVSGGKQLLFLIKTTLNQGIGDTYFLSKKICVKPWTVLIEIMLSGDPLYVFSKQFWPHCV